MPMEEKELYFDIHEQNWILCRDEAWLNKEIEDIPLVIVMECADDYYIWCKDHRRFELIRENDSVDWRTDTCVKRGFPVCFRYRSNKKSGILAEFCYDEGDNRYKNNVKIPVRWRLRIDKKTSTVYIGVDICDVVMLYNNDCFVGFCPRIRQFMYGVSSYEIPNETRTYFQEKISYPKSVIYHSLDLLADLAGNIYGIRPKIPEEKIRDEKTILAFLFRPFDLNCYELTRFVHVSKYVPKDCKNAYYIFCDKLGIEPPKGLKKIYYNNPLALPMYRVLIELGFRDYNLIRLFLDGTQIGSLDFRTVDSYVFPFWDDMDYEAFDADEERKKQQPDISYESDMISQAEIDALLNADAADMIRKRREHREWTQLKFMVDWLMKEKGEMVTAWRLYKYTRSGPKRWQVDISNIIYHYFDSLSDKIKQKFLDKGFTIAVHDNLVYEMNHFDFLRREIKYFSYEEDLECEINGYRFELPRYTDEFADVGREMNNCVASYIPDDSYYKNSLIVVVRKDGRCKACIEVKTDKFDICQALGANNKQLAGEDLIAVNIWAEKMLLKDSTDYLNKNMPSNLDRASIICRNIIGKRTYFIYSLKELLTLSAEERGSGFYRALTTKFVNAELNMDRIPPSILLREIPGKDERNYIHTLFPQLDCVIDAALNGEQEAQIVMAKLYCEFLPRNMVRSEYWRKKADYWHDFPNLVRWVYALDDIMYK